MKIVAILALCGVAACAQAQNRTITGVNNNLLNPSMGSTGADLPRGVSGPHYADGIGALIDRGNPRMISNAMSAQSAAGLGNARNLSSWTWQWGQFLDHDFALVEEGTTEYLPIAVPAGDPHFDPMNTGTVSIDFFRSVHTGGVATPRTHANALTHWLDGSQVYGSDNLRATTLREGVGGRMATSAGGFLPYNTSGIHNLPTNSPNLFLGGDIRANEQVGLTSTHTLFVREHNRLAGLIAAANPTWTDEEIYQRARKLVGAEIQAITYNEWLPAVLGSNAPGAYAGYNDQLDGSIRTEFSSAAFRIGHTLLNSQLLRVNAGGSAFAGGHLTLAQSFFQPQIVVEPGSMEAILRGLGYQQANNVDTQVIDEVRNLLFGVAPGSPVRDLIATNIQRGRDHGLPDYNTLREDYGLSRVASFSEISSDPAIAQALQDVYGSVDNIDPWIGLFAEDHLPDCAMGLTATTIFVDQFTRLREGDRYFYLNDGSLTPDELQFLAGVRLGDILRMNFGITDFSGSVFHAIPAPGSLALLGVAGVLAGRRRRG
ncbi:MAG: peroxidase family protein [Phycisphaeraceae bacterium]|nr:peroxidase family protein [Phycisphaeraceae bacterium]